MAMELQYGNLALLEKYDFWFSVSKIEDSYRILGNCFDYSNAFNFKTPDIEPIFDLIEQWTKIPERLKENIIKQVDKGLCFASNPKPFEREKLFCFKDYSKCRNPYSDPEVMIFKNFNGKPL